MYSIMRRLLVANGRRFRDAVAILGCTCAMQVPGTSFPGCARLVVGNDRDRRPIQERHFGLRAGRDQEPSPVKAAFLHRLRQRGESMTTLAGRLVNQFK